MGISYSDKTLDKSRISCGDHFKIKLSLTGEPDITSNPVDIVLLLDRSGSMSGKPLENMKKGADTFIDIIDKTTDSTQDGQIGGGSRIAIVSFSDTATENTGLITSVSDLKAAVASLSSGGRTNHRAAFEKARALFDPASSNEKIIVIFTDGVTTVGGPAEPEAEAAKAEDAVIYAIGLSGNGGLDENTLKSWASDPDSAYVAITPDDDKLEEIFADIANNISKPGATEITVIDKLTPCFEIVSADTPTKGKATVIDERTVKWEIDELGKEHSEGAEFEFTVRHSGDCTGNVKVNELAVYSDKEKNTVTFPSPSISVECGGIIIPGDCPEPEDAEIEGCENAVEFEAEDLDMRSLGRILQVSVKIKNVCPEKRVALAVIVTEKDKNGHEHSRGLKTLTVPAHHEDGCRDVTVKCINFVLPEDETGYSSDTSICGKRNFKVRLIAHYIDSDFDCCDMID